MKRSFSFLLFALVTFCSFATARVAATAPPSNDDFDNAIVAGVPFTNSQSTVEATTAGDDPNCAGNGPTVWYRLTPTTNGRITANTFGSDFDTTLSVYTGARGALSFLACNDDSGSLQSSVTLDVVAGTTYHFMIGSFASGPGGNLVFSINAAPPPPSVQVTVNPLATVVPSNGLVTLTGTITCSRPVTVSIGGQLQQKRGRTTVMGFPSAFFECTGTTSWTAQVFYSALLFRGRSALLFAGGNAEAIVNAFAFDPVTGEGAFDQAVQSVALRGSSGN
jgi:hypothetical protein